jgi:hypothetical protein
MKIILTATCPFLAILTTEIEKLIWLYSGHSVTTESYLLTYLCNAAVLLMIVRTTSSFVTRLLAD